MPVVVDNLLNQSFICLRADSSNRRNGTVCSEAETSFYRLQGQL